MEGRNMRNITRKFLILASVLVLIWGYGCQEGQNAAPPLEVRRFLF